MKTINYSEISEYIEYVFDCPYCGNYSALVDDPEGRESIWCEECKKEIKLIND